MKNQNLPKNWRKVKLREVLKIRRGASPRPIHEYITKYGMPWLKIADVTSSDSRFVDSTKEFIKKEGVPKSVIVSSGDLILSNSATPGIPKFMRITACVHDGWLILEPIDARINKDFLYYRLIIDREKLISNVTGSIFDNLKTDVLREHEIALPSDGEQKRIADVLSTFDDKIELNNKINQNLEQMAQAIFKEWFVKNSKLKNQNAKLWKTGKIGDLIEIISGYPFSSKLYMTDKKALGVVTIKNVQDGNFITECNSFIRKEDIPENMSPECLISNGDILLSLTGNVGRTCFVYGGEYLLNQRVAKLKPKNKRDLAFCYFLFRQTTMQNQLINMAKGSAQPNLSPVETGEITLSIPPSRQVLDNFSELISPIYKQLVQNAVENQKLAVLRDLLLLKLMSGEIRI